MDKLDQSTQTHTLGSKGASDVKELLLLTTSPSLRPVCLPPSKPAFFLTLPRHAGGFPLLCDGVQIPSSLPMLQPRVCWGLHTPPTSLIRQLGVILIFNFFVYLILQIH